MRRRLCLVLLTAGALALLCSARADAQDAAAQTPAPVPSVAPPDPTAMATPIAPSFDMPQMTPWPWPFAWMDEAAADRDRPTEPPVVAQPQSAAPAGRATARVPSVAPTSFVPDAAAAAAVSVPVASGSEQPVPASQHAVDPTAAYAAATQSSGGVCQPQSVENRLVSAQGAIVQVAAQSEDCSWSAAQVLVSYDVRGPPTVDVLSQSIGMSTDVEVAVTGKRLEMRFGYVGPDGAFTRAAPVVIDPVAGSGAAPRAELAVPRLNSVTANQTGDNAIDVAQDAQTVSGDALSGVQTVSVLIDGDATSVRVLAQNVAPGASAVSGNAVSANAVGGAAGPVAAGVGADAQASQIGDNSIGIAQDASASSGDATAGTQRVNIRISGSAGDVGVLASNLSPGALAVSGDATSTNLGGAAAGPVAASVGGRGGASQLGDNGISIGQSASATSGDALAGAQVIGVSVGGDARRVAVLASNGAAGSIARSGNATSTNLAAAAAGPVAASIGGGAIASQVGANDVLVEQTAAATSGDAVAGSQVVGIEVGGAAQTAVLAGNDAAGTLAASGAAVATNATAGSTGPVAASAGDAVSQQIGSNDIVVDQVAAPATGDATSGSQTVAETVGHAAPDNVGGTSSPIVEEVTGQAATVTEPTIDVVATVPGSDGQGTGPIGSAVPVPPAGGSGVSM